jgi:hypothetical protein
VVTASRPEQDKPSCWFCHEESKTEEGVTMTKELGYVRAYWQREIFPVMSTATVADQPALETLWQRTLSFLKVERGLTNEDSLRNPITQLRNYIRQLPLTEENRVVTDSTGEREHIGLQVFNLGEREWVRMNDRNRAKTQERLNHVRLVPDPEGIVKVAMGLLLSEEWTELVIGIAITTGRRLAEVMKTGTFEVKTPSTLWFEGQVKGRTRVVGRFEIPTLVRSFLVVDAVSKLRQRMDCRELEIEQVSQKYSKPINDRLQEIYGEWIEGREDRDRLVLHNLRHVYASIAVLWYAPDRVSLVNYKAEIQGHRHILNPQVPAGTSAEEVEQIQLNYASHANYADYALADADGKLDGRQGIKLGQPGVTVIDAFKDLAPEPVARRSVKGRRKRQKAEAENATRYSNYHPTVQTRAWGDDLREEMQERLGGRIIKDDEFLRRVFVGYLTGSGLPQDQRQTAALTLEQLDLPSEQRELLQEGMMLAGAPDLLSFLLAAGEREARQLRNQAKRHDSDRYASMKTSALRKMKAAEASMEKFRRAVWAIMHWNEEHDLLARWYVSTLAIQNLVGGDKALINAYLEAHAEEIEEHHQQCEIKPSANRKQQSIKETIQVPDDPTAYPWGRVPEEA